jgi:hypothetical protein
MGKRSGAQKYLILNVLCLCDFHSLTMHSIRQTKILTNHYCGTADTAKDTQSKQINSIVFFRRLSDSSTKPNIRDYVYDRGARGGVVVKAPRYNPAGRGFDSLWCHWNFSVI